MIGKRTTGFIQGDKWKDIELPRDNMKKMKTRWIENDKILGTIIKKCSPKTRLNRPKGKRKKTKRETEETFFSVSRASIVFSILSFLQFFFSLSFFSPSAPSSSSSSSFFLVRSHINVQSVSFLCKIYEYEANHLGFLSACKNIERSPKPLFVKIMEIE